MNTRHQGTHRLAFTSISFLLLSWLPPGADGDFIAHAGETALPTSYSLPQVLDLAMTRHPAVASAEGTVDQSYGQRVTAGAYPNPTVTGYGGHGILKDAPALTAQDLARGGRESLTEYSALVGQPLEWPAMRAARQRAAEAGVAGATVGVVETRLNLTADVKVSFYNLLLAQREQELAKQNLVIVEDVRRIVQTRVKLGEAPQFELIKAEVEVLKANQVVKRTENAVRVNRVVLDTLTAGSLGPAYAIQGDFDAYPKGLKVEPLLTRALDDHPTVQRLTRFVQRAEHGIEFQRQARVPNVTVNGGYYREIGREAYIAGVSVPTPIWYQRQGEVAEALGVKRRDEAELLRAKNLLVKEVNQHWQDARTTSELLAVFEKGLLGQAQEALRIAQFSFLQGAASLLEVLDAQRVQRQILLDYNQARYDLSVSLARLERASGGVLY